MSIFSCDWNYKLFCFVDLIFASVNQKAILFTEGYRFLGGKGDIKVCWPTVEKDDEYSTSQVSLLNGEAYNDYELVEAGWMVRTNFSFTS